MHFKRGFSVLSCLLALAGPAAAQTSCGGAFSQFVNDLKQEAVARGHAPQVFEADFRPMKNVLAGRAERSYMKLVVDAADGRVLGLHMIGADAPEIVQALAVAVTMGAHKRDFDATMAVHPTVAEEFMLMRTPRG